ncbi:unnamed protein product [Bursaphelenchus okinawaensis]|uniref:G-protein coupled receptors family 1 profile domain-containing protein n=1 Tax=Bursaphelenchus okinawaensis TaxID=465554 RepID=A0A811LEX2_9BILA|nr:unnamed protein product [Bursaphelenchus okinawaensis]CAG9121771.1 unnamed protein product [Bursaphelenchus okinawaensis]
MLYITFILTCVFRITSIQAYTFKSEEPIVPRPNIPHDLLEEKSCNLSLMHRKCECYYKIEDTRCCCLDTTDVTEIPKNLALSMKALLIYNTSISHINSDSFSNYMYLKTIQIRNNENLTHINKYAFHRLKHIIHLRISESPKLTELSELIFHPSHRLHALVIRHTGITQIPNFLMDHKSLFVMKVVDFSYNAIKSIPSNSINSVLANKMRLNKNKITEIEENAFVNCHFGSLDLSNNYDLTSLSLEAFIDLKHITELDLSNTRITQLPYLGLKTLKKIRIQKVPTLKQLPSVLAFNHLVEAEFTYPYHCCFFKHATKESNKDENRNFRSNVREIQRRECAILGEEQSISRKRRGTIRSNGGGNFEEWMLNELNKDVEVNRNSDDEVVDSPSKDNYKIQRCEEEAVKEFYLKINCTPPSDALNPCEDIISYPTLRIFLWPMWIIAIVGNISVWFIIAAVWHRRLRFHYFFMLNLSIADFLTGVYLAFLAFADLKTASEYYNYAVEWQTGWGCSVVGFITVFASELSIVSMLMIAFEIYYNARYAFYGKWMSSKTAYVTILLGYAYAFLIAALPLFGISSYEVSSICLPLSIAKPADQLYLVIGLTTTAIAFAGIILNYLMINCMIRGDGTMPARSEDRQILVRTLVLISTDLLCWLPTLFFGITAALGVPLITLTNAKICLILFYPINSCANPLIYVYTTKIWKEVKKKAPFLECKNLKTEKNNANRFYYNTSPSPEKMRSTSLQHDDNYHSKENHTTQTTSLSSTPRGSDSSTLFRHSVAEIEPLQYFSDEHFSEEPDRLEMIRLERKRKSIPSIPTFKFRVQAVPNMSDISESSSNSQEEFERRSSKRSQDKKVSQLALQDTN